MTYDEALQKAAKLLRLAQSNNPNESAAAAAKAQEIIDLYKIEAISLEYDNGKAPIEEEIKNFGDDPIEPGKRAASWKGRLCVIIAKANGCKAYNNSGLGGLSLVGRPSDVSAVRYIFAYVAREVDRLTARDCKGNGRIYANNFRLGIVDTVKLRMEAQRKETQAKATEQLTANLTGESLTLALVRVNSAIAKMDSQTEAVNDWCKSNLRLFASRSNYRQDYTARAAGQKAGHEVRFTQAKGAIA